MYEEFFEFHSRPFAIAPLAKNYFPAASIENARRTLERVIERSEGPGLVIGPPGTGKTLLCQLLAEKFNGPFKVVLLSCGRLKSCQALLQAVHYELKLPYRGLDEGELRLSLVDYLEPTPDGPEGLLLLVDEAHTLPWRLLDEIRLITNLVRDGRPRVQAVLAGGPSLEERFASPKLASFAQRVAGRCYLEHFDRAETSAYVRAQIAAAGGDPAVMVDDETLRSVFRATDGIPRLINQVCDHALVLAALGGHTRLSSEAIDEAWADLQQLPLPWSGEPSHDDASSQIVEFGHLTDDVEAMPEAIPFRACEPQRNLQSRNLHLATPDEQLDAIAEQLSEIEDDRMVSAATEVELDFPEFGDPFSEEFAEEEVVLDRYRTGAEIFADVPRVSSSEGRQIGSLLPPLETPNLWSRNEDKAAAAIFLSTEVEPADAGVLSETVTTANVVDTNEVEFSPAADPVLPEEAALSEPSVTDTAEPSASDAPPRESAVETPAPRPVDDRSRIVAARPAIVVEEDAPARTVPMQPRRSEFRQLFSKLRRG